MTNTLRIEICGNLEKLEDFKNSKGGNEAKKVNVLSIHWLHRNRLLNLCDLFKDLKPLLPFIQKSSKRMHSLFVAIIF